MLRKITFLRNIFQIFQIIFCFFKLPEKYCIWDIAHSCCDGIRGQKNDTPLKLAYMGGRGQIMMYNISEQQPTPPPPEFLFNFFLYNLSCTNLLNFCVV